MLRVIVGSLLTVFLCVMMPCDVDAGALGRRQKRGGAPTQDKQAEPAITIEKGAPVAKDKKKQETQDMIAIMKTSKGDIRLKLFADKVPVTVANFLNLIQRDYYDGLIFHRVIPNFMIQGGCPHGSGRGDPGYRFSDEFDATLRHSKPGILSMANSGPNTNGSQFFITHVPTPWLDGKHSVFGEVLGADDQKVVDRVQQGDRIEDIVLEGDTTFLLEKQHANIEAWNKILDQQFPHLLKY